MFIFLTVISILGWWLSGVEFVRSPELAFAVIVNIIFVFLLSIKFDSTVALD